eukprot:760523-Rhodomonas_salina.1
MVSSEVKAVGQPLGVRRHAHTRDQREVGPEGRVCRVRGRVCARGRGVGGLSAGSGEGRARTGGEAGGAKEEERGVGGQRRREVESKEREGGEGKEREGGREGRPMLATLSTTVSYSESISAA